MRFITFDRDGVDTVGVRFGTDLVDLSIAAPELPRSLLELIQQDLLGEAGGAAKSASSAAWRSLEGVKYRPVIPRPPKFFGMGMNYPSHVKVRPAVPGYFMSGPERLIGHNDPIPVPRRSRTLDYEVELAFVFGKRARNVKEKDALDCIAGYTVFNDASVRGYGGGVTLTLMKNSDGTGPLGPELVTPDELPAGADGLTICLRRNNVVVQNDKTSSMFWKVPETIELITGFMSFEPGDVVTTGTCGGTVVDTNLPDFLADMTDESLPYLKAGEVIESEIEGIGLLRNPIIDEVL